MEPSLDGYSTVTPFTSRRWKARLRASREAPSGVGKLAEGVVEGRVGEVGVEVGEGVVQPLFQDDLIVAGAFGGWCFGGYVRAVCDGPAGCFQPVKGDLLDVGFGEGSHCGSGIAFRKSVFFVHLRTGN